MEGRQNRLIGEELEPGARPKAPGRLELLQRFINTHNHDFPADWDRIGTPAKASAWLGEKGLAAPGEAISDADVVRLVELREALRALLVGPHEEAARRLRALAAAAPLRVAVDERGRTRLEP